MNVIAAARAWAKARRELLSLEMNSPRWRARLNDLSEAEDALRMAVDREWVRVVFAMDCAPEGGGDDGVLVCPFCQTDYAECGCPGPHMDDEYEYEQRPDGLFARKLQDA